MPNGAGIGWQLQGAQWRRFVITPERYKGKTEAKKQERIACTDEHHGTWFAFDAEQQHGPFASAPTSEYEHYPPDFLYDYCECRDHRGSGPHAGRGRPPRGLRVPREVGAQRWRLKCSSASTAPSGVGWREHDRRRR
jgi:hypothetical protein